MSLLRKLKRQRVRRTLRVRKAIKASGLPRVSVFKSLNQIYGQIIDDASHVTLASCSSLQLKNLQGDKKNKARAVGKELARLALEKGISAVAFDRGPFLYHGRIKELAEGLREGGLQV